MDHKLAEENICLMAVRKFYKKFIVKHYTQYTDKFFPQFQCMTNDNNEIIGMKIFHFLEEKKVPILIMTVHNEFLRLVTPNITHQLVEQVKRDNDKALKQIEDDLKMKLAIGKSFTKKNAEQQQPQLENNDNKEQQ